MPISDFTDMMPHTVFVSPHTGFDEYGNPSFGTSVSYTARVVFGSNMVRNDQGDMVVSSGFIWLATTVTISSNDKITFENDTSVSPTVLQQLFPLRIDQYPDEDGFHHVKVHFE